MKKMNNKGQGAMEYLMTYGWAILVVMIVGVVLWQLGVFNPGSGQATVVGFYKIKPLSPGDIQQNRTGGFSGVFINAVGTPISITDIQLTYTNPLVGPVCTLNVNTPGGTLVPMPVTGTGAPVTVGQGGTFFVSTTGCGTTTLVGSTYSAKLSVLYTSEVGGFPRIGNETGTITGPMV